MVLATSESFENCHCLGRNRQAVSRSVEVHSVFCSHL